MKAEEYKPSTIKLTGHYNRMLDEISGKRKSDGNLISQKQSIIWELIKKAHAKECK